jgi:succinate-semialdehyde dehydrogenase
VKPLQSHFMKELPMLDAHLPLVATSRNPATGALIATYPYQSVAEIERLLAANAAAYQVWRATPMEARVATYRKLSATLRARSEMLAALITAEMGKTIAAARAEVEKCAATLDWIADNGPAILADEAVAVESDDQVHVSFLPIGSVLAVMPWNFPLGQVIRASGPIMLSGNGFVLKHAPNVMARHTRCRMRMKRPAFQKACSSTWSRTTRPWAASSTTRASQR